MSMNPEVGTVRARIVMAIVVAVAFIVGFVLSLEEPVTICAGLNCGPQPEP